MKKRVKKGKETEKSFRFQTKIWKGLIVSWRVISSKKLSKRRSKELQEKLEGLATKNPKKSRSDLFKITLVFKNLRTSYKLKENLKTCNFAFALALTLELELLTLNFRNFLIFNAKLETRNSLKQIKKYLKR